MRIGIDARYALTNNRGHGKYIKNLIKALLSIDRSNDYYLFVDAEDNNRLFYGYNNAKVIVAKPHNYIAWEQFSFPVNLKRYKIDIALLSNHSAPLFCTTPYVVTILDTLCFNSLSLSQPIHQIVGRLYKRLGIYVSAKQSKAVLTISEYSKDQIIARLRVPSSKITVTYMGIDIELYQEDCNTTNNCLNSQYGGIESDRYLLCLGASDPRKNTKRIIQAYQKIKKSNITSDKLVVVGISKEECAKMMGVSTDEIDEEIIFTGFIKNEELVSLYKKSSVVIYPSLGEGFGLPILEAMACGVPVITSNIASMPEIAGNAALFVDPYSIDDIAHAINRCVSDSQLCIAMVNSGFERVRCFSWNEVAQNTLNILTMKMH